jgi:hypothetical protein
MKFYNGSKSRDLASVQKSNIYYILQQMKNQPEKK